MLEESVRALVTKQVTVLGHLASCKKNNREDDTSCALSKSKLPAENMNNSRNGKREHQLSSENKEQKQSVRAHTRQHKNAHIKKNAFSGGANR